MPHQLVNILFSALFGRTEQNTILQVWIVPAQIITDENILYRKSPFQPIERLLNPDHDLMKIGRGEFKLTAKGAQLQSPLDLAPDFALASYDGQAG